MNDLILMYAAKFSVLIPFTVYFFLKHKDNKVSRSVFLLACLSIGTEIINEVYIRTGHRGTLVLNLFYVVQFLMISDLYRTHLLAGRFSKLIWGTVAFFLVGFMGVTTFVKEQHLHSPQNWVWTMGNIMIVTYATLHIFHVFKIVDREPPIHRYGPLWVTIAFITYFSYSIGLFFLSDQILSEEMDQRTAIIMWNFHSFYYIVKNLMLTLALYYLSKETERTRIDYKKYGQEEEWWKTLKPNPMKNQPDADSPNNIRPE